MVGNSTTPTGGEDGFVFPFEMPEDCPANQVWLFYFLSDEQLQPFFYSTSQKIIITVLFPIIFALGLIGNTIFLLVVCLNKQMRTITNFYLSNLAVADILFIAVSAVVGFWRYAVSHGLNVTQTFRTSFGCLTSLALVYFTYLASIVLVTLVSFERFLAICYPVKYRSLKNTKNALSLRLVTLAWCVAGVFAAVISPYQGKLQETCVVWPPRDRFRNLPDKIYQCVPLDPAFKDVLAFAQAVPFIIALILIFVLYSKIILVLRAHAVGMVDQQQPGVRNVQKQVTRMVIANGLVYFICLVPYQFIYILDFAWRQYGQNMFVNRWAHDLLLLSRCMSALNSAINPIIYAVANPKYRKAFLKVLKCFKGGSVEPSSMATASTSAMELSEMNTTRNDVEQN